MDNLPVKDEVWMHTKTGNRYVITGSVYNSITDRVDVKYAPLYACDYAEFSRQLIGHPKAFVSKNDDGQPRFQRVFKSYLKLLTDAADEI